MSTGYVALLIFCILKTFHIIRLWLQLVSNFVFFQSSISPLFLNTVESCDPYSSDLVILIVKRAGEYAKALYIELLKEFL